MHNDNTMEKLLNKDNLVLSVIPLPQDNNMSGVVFGGWMLSQFDLAGAIIPRGKTRKNNRRLLTKAVNSVEFVAPIYAGDRVNFYAQLKHQGKTSFVVEMLAKADRYSGKDSQLVGKAEFVYVQVDSVDKG